MLTQIPAQQGAAFVLKKGHLLKVMDPEGEQVSDLFCFNAKDYREMLSSGQSMKHNDSVFLTTDHILYSNRGEPMLKIRKDTCGRHDFLLTPCSLKMFQLVAGNEDYHPSCHENLVRNFAPYGIHEDDITTTFNIFMNVQVQNSGDIKIAAPLSKPGDHIVFEACMDLIVGLTACAHEETNNHTCKPICYQTRSV